ncbi:hypothetical protein BGX24_007621, partial [Mortierella sp. AD032]
VKQATKASLDDDDDKFVGPSWAKRPIYKTNPEQRMRSRQRQRELQQGEYLNHDALTRQDLTPEKVAKHPKGRGQKDIGRVSGRLEGVHGSEGKSCQYEEEAKGRHQT